MNNMTPLHRQMTGVYHAVIHRIGCNGYKFCSGFRPSVYHAVIHRPTDTKPGAHSGKAAALCLMDKQALRIDMLDKLTLAHMPTLRRSLAHSGEPYGPDALRLPCAWRRFSKLSRQKARKATMSNC